MRKPGAKRIRPPDPPSTPLSAWLLQIVLPAAVLAMLVWAAYSNSFAGQFLLDDDDSIAYCPNITEPGFSGSWLRDVCAQMRPVADLTLIWNYSHSKLDRAAYHRTNLLIHIAAALTLFGLVRRTLLTPGLSAAGGRATPRWEPTAAVLALAAASIWAAHPLLTQAVTYVIQRTESLMGMFYLLTMYCALRGHNSRRRGLWYVAAIGACALGMGTKQVMVTAPIVVLLHQRVFAAPSFKEILRRSWPLYAGLAAAWLIMAALLITSSAGPTAGFGGQKLGPSPVQYAMTQLGVIVHYLVLALTLGRQSFHYDWPIATSIAQVWPQAAVIATLLVLMGLALWRRKEAGFAGAMFFLALAPSSSIMPIMDVAFEHRMYLSLAALAALVVIGGYFLIARLTPASARGAVLYAALGLAALAAG